LKKVRKRGGRERDRERERDLRVTHATVLQHARERERV
jgi:hypothetical protein